jgi:alkylhydroperoxidase family enzyme
MSQGGVVSHIEPLRTGEIRDEELIRLIEEAERLGVPDRVFCGIVARVPAYAKALLRAMLISHGDGGIDHRLKEIVRVKLARFARDPYFSTLRSHRAAQQGLDEKAINAGSADDEHQAHFTTAEKIALRYAGLMYLDPDRIDKAFYDEMKEHYSEAQIMELGAFIAFHYGMQVFMRTLDARPEPPGCA